MGNSKIQHYVPQFLLKNFCAGSDQRIHVFDKKREDTFVTNVKNVAAERGFYNVETEDGFYSAESGLSELESIASEIVEKIIDNESLAGLSLLEKHQLSFFAAAQFSRVKQTRIRLKQLDEAIKERLELMGFDPNRVEGYRSFDGSGIKELSILSLAKDAEEYTPFFWNKAWILFKATKSEKFYVSDNPVTLQNQNDFSPFGSLGLAVRGIEIYFPLSSELSLGMYCQTHADAIRSNWRKYLLIKKTNPSKSRDFDLKSIKALKKLKYGLETGRAVWSRNENIINKNSLQVMQSSRFVFSSDGNFDLVREMLDADANFKDPPAIKLV